MLNRIHRTVKFLANSEGRGNVSPGDIDFAIHHRVQEKQEELLFEVNRLVNRQNKGLVNGALENTTEKVREKIQHYLQEETVAVIDGKITIPSGVRYFDMLLYATTYVELCKDHKEFLLSKREATEGYPIGLKTSNKVVLWPSTLASVTVSYLRNPLYAKWTYNTVEGVEMYDPSRSDFMEVDIHPSEESDLIIRVLQSFGINLKEPDLQRITEQVKNSEFNKEMTT